MASRFEVGKAYMATPDVRDAKQVVLACTGRCRGRVTFARVEGLFKVAARGFDGREIATVAIGDGFNYCVASTCEVNLDDAATVLESLRK